MRTILASLLIGGTFALMTPAAFAIDSTGEDNQQATGAPHVVEQTAAAPSMATPDAPAQYSPDAPRVEHDRL